MGDLNSQIGDKPDYIEEVDNVKEQNILDHKYNVYTDKFCDILSSANCIILNCRNAEITAMPSLLQASKAHSKISCKTTNFCYTLVFAVG